MSRAAKTAHDKEIGTLAEKVGAAQEKITATERTLSLLKQYGGRALIKTGNAPAEPAATGRQQGSTPAAMVLSAAQAPPQTPTALSVRSASSVRLPADLPSFKRPDAQDPSTVDDFFSSFQRRLRANNYPMSMYPEALVACCETAEGNWVSENLVGKGLEWNEVRDKFVRHFVDDDISHLYDQALVQCQRARNESLLAFGDRYLTAMKRARRDAEKA